MHIISYDFKSQLHFAIFSFIQIGGCEQVVLIVICVMLKHSTVFCLDIRIHGMILSFV